MVAGVLLISSEQPALARYRLNDEERPNSPQDYDAIRGRQALRMIRN